MYKSAKEIAKNYISEMKDEDFVTAAKYNEVLDELESIRATARGAMPPEFKGWATWWFTNGGSLHGLWKERAYKRIWEFAKLMPKAAWDEQEKRVLAILLNYSEALAVIKYYADIKNYIALDHKGIVQHCVLPGTDMDGMTQYDTLQVIDGTRKFKKYYAGKMARNFLKK